MDKVFLLFHVHPFDNGHEDVKLIGVFSSAEKASAAQTLVSDQPGFRDISQGFSINEYRVDEWIGWREGYVTIQPGEDF